MSAGRVIAGAAWEHTLPWEGCHTAWGQALFTASEATAHFLFLFLGPTNPRDKLESVSEALQLLAVLLSRPSANQPGHNKAFV